MRVPFFLRCRQIPEWRTPACGSGDCARKRATSSGGRIWVAFIERNSSRLYPYKSVAALFTAIKFRVGISSIHIGIGLLSNNNLYLYSDERSISSALLRSEMSRKKTD